MAWPDDGGWGSLLSNAPSNVIHDDDNGPITLD